MVFSLNSTKQKHEYAWNLIILKDQLNITLTQNTTKRKGKKDLGGVSEEC